MPGAGSRRAVIVYVLYTIALSSVFYLAIGFSNHGGGNWVDYTGCLMWCPALGAFLACKHLGRRVSTIAWQWGNPKYHIACYLIPLAYGTIMYVIIWVTGLGRFPNKPFVDLVNKDFGYGEIRPALSIPLYFAFTATIAVIKDFATVLGEEIGWRGFLVPELAKEHGFIPTALISGIIWALWHYPILLFGDYRPPTPVWFYLPVITVNVTLANFLWSWMRLRSGSIWPCVILHAAHNTFIQRFFDPLTVHTRITWYISSEFGIGLLIIAIVLAAYFSSRRSEVETLPATAAGREASGRMIGAGT
jgi:membrane protease YdiL (CAAX protease family)